VSSHKQCISAYCSCKFYISSGQLSCSQL
jgi:hypothetical protein